MKKSTHKIYGIAAYILFVSNVVLMNIINYGEAKYREMYRFGCGGTIYPILDPQWVRNLMYIIPMLIAFLAFTADRKTDSKIARIGYNVLAIAAIIMIPIGFLMSGRLCADP